jgi:hypothetical protein
LFVKQFKYLRAIITKVLFIFLSPYSKKICLTYFAEAEELQDGIGAQLHRIFGILSVCNNLSIPYIHTPIIDFTVTPSDVVRKYIDRVHYCRKIDILFNQYPKKSSVNYLEFQEIIIDRLKLIVLIKYIFLSNLNNQRYLLKIKLPFPLIDSFANWYKEMPKQINVQKIYRRKKKSREKIIAVHFRNGIKSNHKEKIGLSNRWLSDDYFASVINDVIKKNNLEVGRNLLIKIYTDSPKVRQKYFPPKDQLHRYVRSGFVVRKNQISVIPFDFKNSKFNDLLSIEIIHGGDALEAIIEMAKADFLIISRSSMSYCAALLNKKGIIYYPPNFWHAPMPKWVRVKA